MCWLRWRDATVMVSIENLLWMIEVSPGKTATQTGNFSGWLFLDVHQMNLSGGAVCGLSNEACKVTNALFQQLQLQLDWSHNKLLLSVNTWRGNSCYRVTNWFYTSLKSFEILGLKDCVKDLLCTKILTMWGKKEFVFQIQIWSHFAQTYSTS